MSFRSKLLAAFTGTVVVAVTLVAWVVFTATRSAFARVDTARTNALVSQLRREFARQADEVARRIDAVANQDSTLRMAVELSRGEPDYSLYLNTAHDLAAAQRLDTLEIVANDGTIISSAQWPARFGYKEELVSRPLDWSNEKAFLKKEELPNGVSLAMAAVRVVPAGDRKIYLAGGRWLDQDFLASLALPEGMRALLYRNFAPNFLPRDLLDASGAVPDAETLAPLVDQVKRQKTEVTESVRWTSDSASEETFHAVPLAGPAWSDSEGLLGVLLVGSTRREEVLLERRIRWLGVEVGAAGVLLGVGLSLWASARVTRPMVRLAEAAREVAGGNWNARVEVTSHDEIGGLADSFNRMTRQLIEQRERLLQAERVAAWRELARRLAHELKNPLFPLQITVENLLRAREQNPDQFDEVFRESTATLLAELADMKAIVGRFSEFAKMPAPQLQAVNLNEIVRGALKVLQAQLSAPGAPPVMPELDLAENLSTIRGDPELLHRALQNLILNSLDAMPEGGKLTLRTAQPDGPDGFVRLEVADTGAGLAKEEIERLFTPYYTTKLHGTGLGLAIVQSVVSDHGGKISVESEPGRGSTFRIELPLRGKEEQPEATSGGPSLL